MGSKLSYEVEVAKLKAAYWNGLGIATFAVGALPLVFGVGPVVVDPANAPGWEDLLVSASALFPAVGLSRLFHVLSLRSIRKVSE